jgi:DNA ligase (NAD+)
MKNHAAVPQEIHQRAQNLAAEVLRHQTLYHTHDAPEISDEAYDSLVTELLQLEETYPELKKEHLATERVGSVVLEAFQKVTHRHPQWSFDDVFDDAELALWMKKNQKLLEKSGAAQEVTYVCELKIDGLKIIVTYSQGKLVRAATRGDGTVGEDITENIRAVESIPKTLSQPVDITVVGEAWLSRDQLVKINEQRVKAGQATFANPRNAAAGSLRQLDTAVTRSRNLEAFFYEIDELSRNSKVEEFVSQQAVLQMIQTLGLPINPHQELCHTEQDIERYYQHWASERSKVLYDLDGIVIKINEREAQKLLGYTAKAPRFGVAYKFPAEQATSVLQEITWQVGRTGALTPVANIVPTRIAGTVVSRATGAAWKSPSDARRGRATAPSTATDPARDPSGARVRVGRAGGAVRPSTFRLPAWRKARGSTARSTATTRPRATARPSTRASKSVHMPSFTQSRQTHAPSSLARVMVSPIQCALAFSAALVVITTRRHLPLKGPAGTSSCE